MRTQLSSHKRGRAGLGFRLAKSQKPALDIASSLIKLDYDISIFGDRSPFLEDQVGVERYELSPDGRVIEGYHALSLVPLDFMTDDKKLRTPNALLERSGERPLQLATLVVTDPVSEPALEPGIYTIAYRHAGMPRELTKALADGRKALQAAERAKAKGEEPPEATGDWGKTLKKFGITNEEALAGSVDFIRLNPGGLKVPARENRLLIRNAAGDYVTSVLAPVRLQLDGKYRAKGAKVSIETTEGGVETVRFDFGVRTTSKERNKGYTMRLKLVLPPESTGGANWRLPDTPIGATGSSFKVKPSDARDQPRKRVK